MNNTQPKNLLAIDGFAMMFRAFYAVKFAPQYQDKPIGMVFGVANTILSALESFIPSHAFVALDSPKKTFRHQADENYKAQREAPPEEFTNQIDLAKECIDSFELPLIIQPGYEADDIIGTLVTQKSTENLHRNILSGDLDFLQLVSQNITLAKFNGKDPLLFDPQTATEKLGVGVQQVIDYKAIIGDSSDNYKGIPGIGPKTAAKLLAEHESLDKIYQNLEKLSPKIAAKFQEHKDYAYHCRHLAEIHKDVPNLPTIEKLNYQFNPEKFIKFCEKVGWGRMQARAEKCYENMYAQKYEKKPEGQTSLF